jgi:putative phosphoesterase
MTTRVGVVADTHCPEFIARLPAGLFDALGGVDLILHAGDINARQTIAELERIAPVHAVRGDHDANLAGLPSINEVVVEGRRIVLVHGNRSRWIEEPQTLLWTLSLGYFHPHDDLPRSLHRRFADADVIVFGHTHNPYVARFGRTLLFNPGAVHVWNPTTTAVRLTQRPGWFEWCWLQVARHLRSYATPSVGILEVSRDAIVPTVVRLTVSE